MKLYILYRRALDRLGRLFEDALGEDDALDREPRGPLGHLFADLFWGDGEESLDRVRALAKVKENHLAPLRARCLDAGAEEDRLPVHGPVKVCDLRARAPRASLRLVQRELAVERGGVVLCGTGGEAESMKADWGGGG